MDNGPRRTIFRPNAQQLRQLAVPPVAHNPLLSRIDGVTGDDSNVDSPIPYSETPSRWTLTACTVKSAMTAASFYSQGSWDQNSPVETNIKTDPRRFAIALSPGRLVLSGSLWTHDEHYEDIESGEDEGGDDSMEEGVSEEGHWEMVNEAQWMSSTKAPRPLPKLPQEPKGIPRKQVRWAAVDDSQSDDSHSEHEQVGDLLIDTPSRTAFVLQLRQASSDCEPAKHTEAVVQTDTVNNGTLILVPNRACGEHKWPEEMEKELDAIDKWQQEKKKRRKIYSVAYKRVSRPTGLFSRVFSRLSIQSHSTSTSPSPVATSKSTVIRKPAPSPLSRDSPKQVARNQRRSRVSMRPPSRRFSRFQLALPDVALSPLSVSFVSPSTTTSFDKPPTPYPEGVPPHDPEAEYDRFQAMERLRKLVTPLDHSFSSAAPSPLAQPSMVHTPHPATVAPAHVKHAVDTYHAMEKLRKLRFSAAGERHKRNLSNPSYVSDWDFRDSPLQLMRPPSPPVPTAANIGQLVHRRSRSADATRRRPSPLNLTTPGVSIAAPVALAF